MWSLKHHTPSAPTQKHVGLKYQHDPGADLREVEGIPAESAILHSRLNRSPSDPAEDSRGSLQQAMEPSTRTPPLGDAQRGARLRRN